MHASRYVQLSRVTAAVARVSCVCCGSSRDLAAWLQKIYVEAGLKVSKQSSRIETVGQSNVSAARSRARGGGAPARAHPTACARVISCVSAPRHVSRAVVNGSSEP